MTTSVTFVVQDNAQKLHLIQSDMLVYTGFFNAEKAWAWWGDAYPDVFDAVFGSNLPPRMAPTVIGVLEGTAYWKEEEDRRLG